jgi:large subunit ribosomal protein L5
MRLKEKYEKEVVPKMMEIFGFKNKMAVPKIEKVVINCGFGRLVAGKTEKEKEGIIKNIVHDLSMITGQKPVLTRAKESISAFKIKKGEEVGAKVTLRRKRMYDFLERLINIGLPRSKDFKGVERSWFDQSGNLNIGIKEQIAFPEVSPEETKFIFGFEVTIVTNAKKREEAIELMRLLGFPIKPAS